MSHPSATSESAHTAAPPTTAAASSFSNADKPASSSSSSSSTNTNRKPHRFDPRSHPVDEQLSRALAYILRHGALKEGLSVRPDGYVMLDHVLARPRIKSLNMTQDGGKATRPRLDDVKRIVESNDKKRYELSEQDGLWLVRAVQGHSLKEVTALSHIQLTPDNLHLLRPGVPFPGSVQGSTAALQQGPQRDSLESRLASTTLESEAHTQPVLVIHGTDAAAWDKIRESGGLRPMTRNHIHLAKGRPGEEGVISGMRKSSTRLIYIDIGAAVRDGIPVFLSSNGVVLTPGVVPADTPQHAILPRTDERNDEAATVSAGKRGVSDGGKGGGQGSEGTLPLRYFVRVEDQKGRTVWTP